MKRFLLALFLPAFLLLAACETGPSTESLIVAQCRAATGAINVLTGMKAQGKLSEQNIKDVDAAISVIDPICSADTPPTGTAYLTSLQMGMLQLQGVQTNLGK